MSHGLPLRVFVQLVPVVLRATEDELAIFLVLRDEASAARPPRLARSVVSLGQPGGKPGVRAVHARWLRAQTRMPRAMLRPEIINMKQLLQ